MKKKQKKSASAATEVDLKTLISEHRLFFDKLIDLIPARFYLPIDTDNKPYFQGLSKAKKASAKLQSKKNLKLARRNRLDPDKIQDSSTLQLLNQSLKKNDDGNSLLPPINLEDDDDDDVDNPNPNPKNENVTLEELQLKLRRKIELLRGNRGEGPENSSSTSNRSRRKLEAIGRKNEGKKRKRGDGDGDGDDGVVEKEEIQFGKVKLGDDEDGNKRRKKKKVSKAKELERLKRLEEVKKENRTVADKELWKAAEKRAMGLKVHDDMSKLKVSMKKEKRRKEKSKEKWKDRVETQEKLKNERQKKRSDNIAGKIKEKKMRKIAKREKKLLRPGFEGRKDGYITQDKS